TYEWLDSLPSTYPDIVSLETIGSSWQGRDLKLIRFNKDWGIPKTAAFIVANMHARERITSATLTWIMNELLANPVYERILNEYDLHFLPIANPDGLERSQTTDRMWRKTMSDHDPEDGCIGVDPEQNFDFHWSDSGPCSSGPAPFSESETRAIADYVLENMPQLDFKLYLNIHSFSQFVLFPWGYTATHPDDYDDLVSLSLSPIHCVEHHRGHCLEVARITESALEERYGTQYESGTYTDLLYRILGTSTDWMKGVAGIKYSYQYELRDTGEFAFLLPPDQIVPSGEETLDGLVALLDAVRERSRENAL
ncbi:unnamed protein product, partial [Darwinula stevensoni]